MNLISLSNEKAIFTTTAHHLNKSHAMINEHAARIHIHTKHLPLEFHILNAFLCSLNYSHSQAISVNIVIVELNLKN